MYEKLRKIWESEKRPQYVIFQGATYEVLTPNGEEEPIFRDLGSGENLYNTLSTEGLFSDKKTPSAKGSAKRDKRSATTTTREKVIRPEGIPEGGEPEPQGDSGE